MAISQQRINRMVRRWNALRNADSTNDRAKALFFRDERRGYINGDGGTQQFIADVNKYLTGINGAKAMNYVRLLRNFRTERDWKALGGYSTLYYLMGLDITTAQRNRLKTACRARADRDGQPITRNIASGLAHDLGYESRRGRPNQTAMERKRDILAQFIYENVDGNIPQAVVDAMPHNLQAQYS